MFLRVAHENIIELVVEFYCFMHNYTFLFMKHTYVLDYAMDDRVCKM